MRLFIALEPDNGIKRKLAFAQNRLRESGVGGNFTQPENLHITLAFIGEYGDPKKVLSVMRSVPFRGCRAEFDGTGCFPGICYAKVNVGKDLYSYVNELRSALGSAGIPYDKKRFAPHITLIRKVCGDIPDGVMINGFAEIDRVTLFRSDRVGGRMIYTGIGYAVMTEEK